MKVVRNQLSCFWILGAFSIVFLFSSCATSSMTGVKKEPSQTNENEKILETVKNFWKVSAEGDKENLPNYIREAPDEFSEPCPSAANRNSNLPGNLYSEDSNKIESNINAKLHIMPGRSLVNPKYEFLSLKDFSQQIKDKNVELVKATVERATGNEAVVKIDWRKFNSGEGWISHEMLLYKDNTGWKIFMITSPPTLEKYNKSFGYEDKCS